MTTQFDENSNLTIQLLSYSRQNELTEQFYFLEMSTLQASTLLLDDEKIRSARIFAYTKDDKYLDENITAGFKTVKEFNEFFLNNSEYYIHDCEIEFESGIILTSHDDGEVSVGFLIENLDQELLYRIFEEYKLDRKLIEILKAKPGHYIAIDKQNNITADYTNFEDYLENG